MRNETNRSDLASPHKNQALPNIEEIIAGLDDDERLLRLNEVTKKVGLGSSTIYRLMNEGKFPRAIQIGENSVRWLSSDIKKWIADRILKRDAGEDA